MQDDRSELFKKMTEMEARMEMEKPAGNPVFMVGETVEIRGRKYKIRKITKKDLILRPHEWNQEAPND